MLYVKTNNPAVNELDLANFEEAHDVVIPAEYRKFLLLHNGGHPVPSDFVLYPRFPGNEHWHGKGEDTSVVAWFKAINSEHENLAETLDAMVGRLPSGFFPFARDPFGNQICLATEGPLAGQVFFWDHEFEADPDEGEVPTMRNVYYIADSFQAFLDGLFDSEA